MLSFVQVTRSPARIEIERGLNAELYPAGVDDPDCVPGAEHRAAGSGEREDEDDDAGDRGRHDAWWSRHGQRYVLVPRTDYDRPPGTGS